MRNYQVTPEQIITEIYNIFSDEHRSRQYYNTMGAQYLGLCGWAGPMSPENRAAFVDAFGLETIETAEKVARARVAAYRAAYEASHYHRHEIEANEADPDQVPAVGSFVWCFGDGLKCEGGPMDPLKNHCEEWSDFRPELVEIAAVVTVPAADLLTADTAHRIAREYTGHQGGRYEEADPLRLDGRPYAWTVGVLVTDGARWYVVDSEGYDYARYILQPLTMADMYAPEIASIRQEIARREAEEAARVQAAADERRRVYLERCARWEGAGLVDVRPLDEAAAEANRLHGWRSKEAKSAQRKADAARRRNILIMCQTAAPGVKFSVRKWDGWGGSYCVSWTDGPTADSLKAAADLDLLEEGRDTFDGMTDCAGHERAEFVEFSKKYLGVFGEINTERETSEEFRAEIIARIREAVPGLPEGDQTPTDEAQAWKVADAAADISGDEADRRHVADMAERYGLREAAHYVARVTSRPTTSEAPTDPTPDNGGTGADAAPYVDCEKSQPQEEAPALQLVNIDGEGVAVVGDSRTTYRHRRLIKACGAKWNKTAQQWEAYDPEAIANLREWLPACRPARPTDPDGLGEEETVPAPAPESAPVVDATPTKEEPAQLPEPPAAVVYDAAQPIESAPFVAVDATGAPYGDSQKSQISEIEEEPQLPELKKYRLMYLFGAWVCYRSIYAETDAEAIHDAMDMYIASILPRWSHRVALWEGSRLVHDIKGNGPDELGRRDIEKAKEEGATVYTIRDARPQPYACEYPATRSILAAANHAQNNELANPHPLQIFADGVKIWDSEEDHTGGLAYIVRQRLGVPYGYFQKSQICEATASAAELEAEELAENTAEYDRLKAKHPDALLHFRVGEFYELWNDDAEIAADVLGLTLTLAHGGLKMCAFPYHALDTYLPKLIRAGHRVCICDDPRPKRSPRPKKATA